MEQSKLYVINGYNTTEILDDSHQYFSCVSYTLPTNFTFVVGDIEYTYYCVNYAATTSTTYSC